MKLYIAIAVLAFLAVVYSQGVTQWGNTNDTRIHIQFITKSSKIMQKVIEEINVNQTSLNWRIISGVKVTDQLKEKNRGDVALTAGGIGFNFVNVRFKSARGEKIESILEIYGR
jgi:hypothetical protein